MILRGNHSDEDGHVQVQTETGIKPHKYKGMEDGLLFQFEQ